MSFAALQKLGQRVKKHMLESRKTIKMALDWRVKPRYSVYPFKGSEWSNMIKSSWDLQKKFFR